MMLKDCMCSVFAVDVWWCDGVECALGLALATTSGGKWECLVLLLLSEYLCVLCLDQVLENIVLVKSFFL